MRVSRTLFVHVTVCLCLAAVSGRAAPDPQAWFTNPGEAGREAQRSGKPMLIHFWADWCEPCHAMDREVYTPAFVASLSKRMVPVRIEADRRRDVTRKYNVIELPSLVFTDSYGNELFRYSGYMGAKTMADVLDALPVDVSEYNSFGKVLATDASSFEALRGMALRLRGAGLYRASNDYCLRALQSREGRSGPKREALLDALAGNYMALRDVPATAAILSQCLREFPSSPRKLEWTVVLCRAWVLTDRRSKARDLAETYVHENPSASDSPSFRALYDYLAR